MVGALEASRDTETGQEASRAAPVPEPTVERGAWASMAEPYYPPQKNFLGENMGYIGHLGAHGKRRLLGALGKRLGKRGLVGALWKR